MENRAFRKFEWSAWKLLDCGILHQIPKGLWEPWAAPKPPAESNEPPSENFCLRACKHTVYSLLDYTFFKMCFNNATETNDSSSRNALTRKISWRRKESGRLGYGICRKCRFETFHVQMFSGTRILTHSKLKNTYFWRQTWMLYIHLIMSVSWKKNPQDHEILGVGVFDTGFFLKKTLLAQIVTKV